MNRPASGVRMGRARHLDLLQAKQGRIKPELLCLGLLEQWKPPPVRDAVAPRCHVNGTGLYADKISNCAGATKGAYECLDVRNFCHNVPFITPRYVSQYHILKFARVFKTR